MAPEAPKYILVVEDDETTRQSLATALRDAGFDVVTAGNGQEALDYVHSHPPPVLILLDMMMPAHDGWEFLRLRGQDPTLAGVPVIVLTALGVASELWARSLGA